MKLWERQEARREVVNAAHSAVDALAKMPDDSEELADVKESLHIEADRAKRLAKENEELKAQNKVLSRLPEARAFEVIGKELQNAIDENHSLRDRIDGLGKLNSEEYLAMYRCNGYVDRGGFYVYQLVDQSKFESCVVYVGQSSALMTRMQGHKDKEWTHVRYEQVRTKREMDAHEADLIHSRHPKYNKHCPKCGSINKSEALCCALASPPS